MFQGPVPSEDRRPDGAGGPATEWHAGGTLLPGTAWTHAGKLLFLRSIPGRLGLNVLATLTLGSRSSI